MDLQKGQFQFSALKWLYELELIDDPQLINNLKGNLFSISPHVSEVEFIASYQNKQMLIWLELTWIGRVFLKERILTAATERVNALLPNFKVRVVTDRAILDLAVSKVKNALTGAPSNEKTLNSPIVSESDPKPST